MTPTLSAPGIVLRPLVRDDAEALFVTLGDADVQKYRLQPAHADVAQTARYIEGTLAKGHGWAVTEAGGEALGRIALRNPEPGVGEFGIALRRTAHGRGLASRAVSLVERYAFTELGLTHLRAEIDEENAASLALFARAGFAREAYCPASAVTHRGVRNSVIMGKQRT